MDDEVVFSARNRHNVEAGLPPMEAREGNDKYRAYFENQFGEQLIFVYDRDTDQAILYHGDVDWEPRTVREESGIIMVSMTLGDLEREWLSVCWRTATAFTRLR